jgi:hypothetical protein
MPYDPQRGRRRPEPADDSPAPVEALLGDTPDGEGQTRIAQHPPLPDGVELDVTAGGEVVISTADAEVEVTPLGDDVVVRTDDATVEVRAEDDSVLVSTGDEDVTIDTTPRDVIDLEDELDAVLGAHAVDAGGARRTRLLVVAALVALVALLVTRALRRRGD